MIKKLTLKFSSFILAILLLNSCTTSSNYNINNIDQVTENKLQQGHSVLELLEKNRINNPKEITLKVKVDEIYKSYLIQAVSNIDIDVNLIFEEDAEIIITPDIINGILPGFCNSYQYDQLASIEKAIFSSDLPDYKHTLIIYEKSFDSQKDKLINKYKNIKTVAYKGEQYEEFAAKILGVSESNNRYKKINALLPNININNSPRVNKDIENIYFLMTYENAKGLVPAFRYNYSININSYASINLIESINDFNKIIDFESLIMPASYYFKDKIFIDQFSKNKSVLDRLIYDNLHDVIALKILSLNNVNKGIFNGRSGLLSIQNSQCVTRELPLKKINSEGNLILV